MKWYRVNKRSRCAICRKHDWCAYAPDAELVLCMRVESEKPAKSGGWFHSTKIDIPVYIAPKQEEKEIDFYALWRKMLDETKDAQLQSFAMNLGVSYDSLKEIGCVRSNNAWAFPMWSADEQIIGIRLRGDNGQKWAVKGSHQGIFISIGYPEKLLYIVEGVTDLAAALTLGLSAIGRPSCIGQEKIILDYIKSNRISRVVIISDNDKPGLNGANKLQKMLPVMSSMLVLPCKDVREFIRIGGSSAIINLMLHDLVWTR